MNQSDSGFEERRKHPRVKTAHLISYVNKEGGRQKTPISMGKTLNLSAGGAALQVYQWINPNSVMEMEIGVGEWSVPVQGKVVHARQIDLNTFVVGIQFNEVQEELFRKIQDAGMLDLPESFSA